MPRKIRQLIGELHGAGFSLINKHGKGNHTKLRHPKGVTAILSGHLGDDAKRYQEKHVKQKIQESKK